MRRDATPASQQDNDPANRINPPTATTEGHPLHLRLDLIDDLEGAKVANWAKKALHEGVHLVTDGLASFAFAGAVVGELGANVVSPRQSRDLGVFD